MTRSGIRSTSARCSWRCHSSFWVSSRGILSDNRFRSDSWCGLRRRRRYSGDRRTPRAESDRDMATNSSKNADGVLAPSDLIDQRIEELGDWRGEKLAEIRELVHRADPEVVEEWKWRGVPTWSHAGMICTGETYKKIVKVTFAKGASLDDPTGMFNSSLEGNTRRAIDFHEDDEIDGAAFAALVRAAVQLNLSK
ncbi:conserved hypothetical protein [Prescottella equi 103S]|nr:conserved hypothetical protein [Prescottella equi 103S]